MRKVLVTGAAGFIGFHLCKLLLEDGFRVHGFDGFTDYYDVSLKHQRHALLEAYEHYSSTTGLVEDMTLLRETALDFQPDVILHFAGQAGVRYSLENPRAYVDTNLVGTFNVMEIARELQPKHLLIASSSSVYGVSDETPFTEAQQTDHPITIYAATKKAAEVMAHSYAHIHNLPTTMFRFFTVYGPWGRPDMAPFKFTKAIMNGDPIDIYNNGEMWRDFTYVNDLVQGVRLLMDAVPPGPDARATPVSNDSLSAVAPYRIVNIGNATKVKLLDFIEEIERASGQTAIRNYLPMQTGDVPITWADSQLLFELTGFRATTRIDKGVAEFVRWYREYRHD